MEQAERFSKTFKYHAETQLLCASPLRRALQTCLIAFKPETIRGLRVTAVPGAQEARDTPSDTGSDVSVLQPEFGEIVNFEEVGQDWQKKEGGNSIDMKSLHERARKLRLWLRKRPETEIVLVMHGLFAHYMTGNIDENGNQTGNV
jgi:broad specificity phosphatase PhoE